MIQLTGSRSISTVLPVSSGINFGSVLNYIVWLRKVGNVNTARLHDGTLTFRQRLNQVVSRDDQFQIRATDCIRLDIGDDLPIAYRNSGPPPWFTGEQ